MQSFCGADLLVLIVGKSVPSRCRAEMFGISFSNSMPGSGASSPGGGPFLALLIASCAAVEMCL